jgi:predicted Abi (CAAX) family protease
MRRTEDRRMLLTLILIVAAVAVAVAWILGVVDIFRRRMDAKHTVAWLLVVLIVPIIGTIVYWVLRPPDPGDFARAEAAQRDIRQHRHDGSGFGM